LETLLDELSIKHLRNSKAFALSGGERRRLEITRALVTQPKFMMLDEPFAGVDPIAVHDIQQIVGNLRHRGIGVLISDHNVEQTLDIVDRAYIMFDGQVKVSGTVRELVFDDTVADIYLGPTLTARLRGRFEENDGARVGGHRLRVDEPAASSNASTASPGELNDS
jgi:lipopolysaccharide export system ATP-binding protein